LALLKLHLKLAVVIERSDEKCPKAQTKIFYPNRISGYLWTAGLNTLKGRLITYKRRHV